MRKAFSSAVSPNLCEFNDCCPVGGLKTKLLEQSIHCQFVVAGNVFEHVLKSTYFDWAVIRHGDVVLPIPLRGHDNMRTGLAAC